jgi:uncharacterized protein YfaQ (DUF2300 family)
MRRLLALVPATALLACLAPGYLAPAPAIAGTCTGGAFGVYRCYNPNPRPAGPPATAAPVSDGSAMCAQVIAYLQANQAPNFSDSCYPNASEGPCAAVAAHASGCTTARTASNGAVYGSIYIDSNCRSPIPTENEASNSRLLAGLSSAPVDPYGHPGC